jgi:hypothetical protein
MEIILAKPLLLVPLSTQIEELGGNGFNAHVDVQHEAGTFSSLYRFTASSSTEKVLKTRNEFQCGVISAKYSHYVMYNADTMDYQIVTPRTLKVHPFKILLITDIGCSFNEALMNLKNLFPERVVWNLTDPAKVDLETGKLRQK